MREFEVGQRVSAHDSRVDGWPLATIVRVVREGSPSYYCGNRACCGDAEPSVYEVRFEDGHLAELPDDEIDRL